MTSRMSALPLLLVLIGAVLLLLLAGCRRETPMPAPPPSVPDTRALASAQGYIIDIPNDWILEEKKPLLVDIIALEPMTSGAAMTGNINVVIQDSSMSTDQYCRSAKQIMRKAKELPHFAAISTTDFAGKTHGKKLIYTWVMEGNLPVKACAYMFTNGSKAYALTGTMNVSAFAKYEPLYDQIATSFRWKE